MNSEDPRTGLHRLVLWLYHNKWKVIFWLTAITLFLWGVVAITSWWFNRTIGVADNQAGVLLFGLGVVVVFAIWNFLD